MSTFRAYYHFPEDAPAAEVTAATIDVRETALDLMVAAPYGSAERAAWREVALAHGAPDGHYHVRYPINN